MIPRTKHLVVTTLSLVGILMLSGVLMLPHKTGALFSEHGSPALLIESDNASPEVVIEMSSLREDMRVKLRDALRNYVHTAPDTKVLTMPTPEVSVEAGGEDDRSSATPASSVLLCDGVSATPPPISTWGPVRIAIGEGARVVRTSEEGDDGLPVDSMQFPLEPFVNDAPSCLPGVIGILVDGSVLSPYTPVTKLFEGLSGYAVDGFPIFAQYEDGRKITNADLDQCHGHVHEIVDQGVVRSVYHYHITEEAPYTLGCLMGTAVEW